MLKLFPLYNDGYSYLFACNDRPQICLKFDHLFFGEALFKIEVLIYRLNLALYQINESQNILSFSIIMDTAMPKCYPPLQSWFYYGRIFVCIDYPSDLSKVE